MMFWFCTYRLCLCLSVSYFSLILFFTFLIHFLFIFHYIVLYTQNITNTDDDVTVFPGIVVQLTCQTNLSSIIWAIPNGGGTTFVNSIDNSTMFGGFNILAFMEGSLFVSTATITAMNNVSLECRASNASIITISIKPVEPQCKCLVILW